MNGRTKGLPIFGTRKRSAFSTFLDRMIPFVKERFLISFLFFAGKLRWPTEFFKDDIMESCLHWFKYFDLNRQHWTLNRWWGRGFENYATWIEPNQWRKFHQISALLDLWLLFSAELKPHGYYLELLWQADLGYIGQAISEVTKYQIVATWLLFSTEEYEKTRKIITFGSNLSLKSHYVWI